MDIEAGNNFLETVQKIGKPAVVAGLIFFGLYFMFKKKTTELLITVIIAVIGIVLVFNPLGVTDLLLKFGNNILGIQQVG